MQAVNPIKPSLSLPIRFVTDAGDAVPIRRGSSRRSWRAAAAALAAAVAVVAAGAAASDLVATKPSAAGPVRGEFRLAPGNQMPPGIVVPLRGAAGGPARGEFRLGPGNAMPPGVIVPLR